MVEKVNPTDGADPNPDAEVAGSGEKSGADPSAKGSDSKPEPSKEEPTPAQRKLQSDRDKARAGEKTTQEQLEELQAHVYGGEVQKQLGEFLKENKTKFPDVEESDLSGAESLDPEDLAAAATKAQGRFDKVRNDALKKVQEVPEQTLSEEEKAQALKEIEESEVKPGQSKFGQFLNLKRTKTR